MGVGVPLPCVQTWCAACGRSLLLNPALLLLLKVVIEERLARGALILLRSYNCRAEGGGGREVFEHVSLSLGLNQKH